ncbi:RHS repeat domain-containing protein [Bremerella cremea]|uniref:RHS repeat domain-containing protein n=1 Tax=Bremerella cremea TaxID=1031537 RepID=UPI001314E39F|nr:RHS repeat-associated core domain-containing protein [Bremerella cremea]
MADFAYDGLNRRILRDANSLATHFYYNQYWQCLERSGAASTASLQYVWGQRYIDDLALSETSNTRPFYCQDANYNVVAAIEDSGGAIERYAYSLYGSTVVLDGAFSPKSSGLIGNEILYTGRRLDTDTGLYQFRNRYFRSGLGMFLSRDPMGYSDGPGLYEYVGSNPILMLDPMGLSCTESKTQLNYPFPWDESDPPRKWSLLKGKLPIEFDIEASVNCTKKICDEGCGCSLEAQKVTTDCRVNFGLKVQAKIKIRLDTVTAAAGTSVTVGGMFQLSGRIVHGEGGCKDEQYTDLCLNMRGQLFLKCCPVDWSWWGKACGSVKITCDNSICGGGYMPSGTPSSSPFGLEKCSVKITGEACLLGYCQEKTFWNEDDGWL